MEMTVCVKSTPLSQSHLHPGRGSEVGRRWLAQGKAPAVLVHNAPRLPPPIGHGKGLWTSSGDVLPRSWESGVRNRVTRSAAGAGRPHPVARGRFVGMEGPLGTQRSGVPAVEGADAPGVLHLLAPEMQFRVW